VPGQLTLDADLRIDVDLPGHRRVSGTLTGSGTHLELRLSDPFLFAGRGDTATVNHLAETLARSGLSVTVHAPSGPLVTLGAPRTHWWQRRVTGSRHVRIERGASLWSLARGRARASAARALPSSDLVPSATLWPLLPTLRRRPAGVSTTHDPAGGGYPRLIMAPREHPGPGDVQEVFALRGEVTTIGSAPEADVRIPGLLPRQAEVRRDDLDEYVVHRLGRPGDLLVNGAAVDEAVLRTATRLQLGEWTMSFYREEHADHGRPFGGRAGGEIGHQRAQPARAGHPAEWTA
jgi:hypothetical protein